VDYYEKGENLWHIVTHLKDHIHDIVVTLGISTPDMIIQDADIKFIRYPREGCIKFIEKFKVLEGANLITDLRQKLTQLMGPEGCPNAMNLVSMAAPAFPFFYFPSLISKGRMEEEEWLEMEHKNWAGNCIAH
jgi:hypothetical protein